MDRRAHPAEGIPIIHAGRPYPRAAAASQESACARRDLLIQLGLAKRKKRNADSPTGGGEDGE